MNLSAREGCVGTSGSLLHPPPAPQIKHNRDRESEVCWEAPWLKVRRPDLGTGSLGKEGRGVGVQGMAFVKAQKLLEEHGKF